MSDEAVRLVCLISVIIFGLWAADIHPFSDEVTIYSKHCELPGFDASGDCRSEFYYSAHTYKINTYNNSITFWSESWGGARNQKVMDGGVEKYSDCAIKDKDNWSCATGYTYPFIMSEGHIAAYENGANKTTWKINYYFHKWQY